MLPRIERYVTFVAVALVPIAFLVLTFRHETKVALAFIEYIYISYLFSIVALCLFAVAFAVVAKVMRPRLFVYYIRSMMAGKPWLYLPVIIAALILLVQLVRIEYRYFSEAWYPRRALRAFGAGNFLEARLICDRYFDLYPRRMPGGSYPDPVCAPVRVFMERSKILKNYISSQRPRAAQVGNMRVGVPWQTRREAMNILSQWSGE